MEWINVNKKLPENDDYVLIYLEEDEIWIGYYTNNNWHIDEVGDVKGILYWMEFPEKPII